MLLIISLPGEKRGMYLQLLSKRTLLEVLMAISQVYFYNSVFCAEYLILFKFIFNRQ